MQPGGKEKGKRWVSVNVLYQDRTKGERKGNMLSEA